MSSLSPHHTDLSLFTGAGRTDEHLQLDSQLFILSEDLIELLHKVLRLSSIWQVLWKHHHNRMWMLLRGIKCGQLKKVRVAQAENVCLDVLPTYWQYSSASQTWQCYWPRTVRVKKEKMWCRVISIRKHKGVNFFWVRLCINTPLAVCGGPATLWQGLWACSDTSTSHSEPWNQKRDRGGGKNTGFDPCVCPWLIATRLVCVFMLCVYEYNYTNTG